MNSIHPYRTLKFQIRQISERVHGEIIGDDSLEITGIASVEEAEQGELVFAESPRFIAAALRSRASAILVSKEIAPLEGSKTLILVENPRESFVEVLEMFTPARFEQPGIDKSASIGTGVQIGRDVHIGHGVTVGDRVVLGDRVILLPGVRVGHDCVIGDDTILNPNVVFYPRISTGKQCIFHAGCVIGADGFGYIQIGYGLKKIPQLGIVEIGDEVEIGANTCIDRAKTGATIIGAGTKIDNLVHVAHNVHIGMSCLLIAQTGIAGSVNIGDGVILAGQAGVKDHVTLGSGSRVGAQGGVIGDVAAGATVSGYPARPHNEKMREYAALGSLPAYVKRIRELEKRLSELDIRLQGPHETEPKESIE